MLYKIRYDKIVRSQTMLCYHGDVKSLKAINLTLHLN